MNTAQTQTTKPDWERLYEIAAAQDGYFSTRQAADAGYSRPLLHHHVQAGRIQRIRHGIYRLAQFPPSDHEDLVVIWLWSNQQGVFGYETALTLQNLSDVMPSKVHLILPLAWQARRFRIPKGVVLHYGNISENERMWVGSVPITNTARTLTDCSNASVAPDFVRDAFEEAADRGLIGRDSVPEVITYLAGFFSVSRSRSGPRFGSSSGSRTGSKSRSSSTRRSRS